MSHKNHAREILAAAIAMTLVVALPAAARPARAPADSTAAAATPPPLERGMLVRPASPLLLDPTDMGLGSTVVFDRIPNSGDIDDLAFLPSVQHVVLTLSEWPSGYEQLQPLNQALFPEGADLIVVISGYPRTHASAECWNLLHRPLRLIVVVPGPPDDRTTILELNVIRGLERVVADMPEPSRSGFERLQRPLSFRVFRP